MYRSTSLAVSASEWALSAARAAEPVSSAAAPLATAMARFATNATKTVRPVVGAFRRRDRCAMLGRTSAFLFKSSSPTGANAVARDRDLAGVPSDLLLPVPWRPYPRRRLHIPHLWCTTDPSSRRNTHGEQHVDRSGRGVRHGSRAPTGAVVGDTRGRSDLAQRIGRAV